MAYTSTHWGIYRPNVRDNRLVGMEPAGWDPDPSPIGGSMPESVHGASRVRRPAVRRGFLRHGAKSREERGREPFVELPWDEALDLVAGVLRQIRADHGNAAIFGGGYGWSSAGRFHHAQSQMHRFLNVIGGFTDSVDSYSIAAGRVILRRVAVPIEQILFDHTGWATLARHTDLFVAFGGLPARNAQVSPGGAATHVVPDALRAMAARGTRFVNVSPVRGDLDTVDAEWIRLRPGTDTALMLALAHVLVAEQRQDTAFLARCSVGFDTFRDYLTGAADGVPKDPAWAAAITGVPPDEIVGLARRMAAGRTMLNAAWALQRAEHGEQPYWMVVTLAAMIGQIGLPGGGFGVGYGGMNNVGTGRPAFSGPRLPQGANPIKSFIPCARLADMLLHPGEEFAYDGARQHYPDIRAIYWAGGNVFHHHQDINRLIRAWRRPEAVIVHEQYWTAHAKFSDIVLPATLSLERNDIGSASAESVIVAMKQALSPVGEARDDYAIFTGLAERFGCGTAFTEGRDAQSWIRCLYEDSRERAHAFGLELPDFDAFWAEEVVHLPSAAGDRVMLGSFCSDPNQAPLPTSSGRIEISCAALGEIGDPKIVSHPVWREPAEWLGAARAATYPLHLLSHQPRTRLHSQYDHGGLSRASKIAGREPLTMHAGDAAERGIVAGDIVRVFNDRGAFLAGVVLSDALMPGVVQIATGAWYDPLTPGEVGSLDKHGNPNMVTPDIGSSPLSQGCSAQSALVQVELFHGDLPPITAFDPPLFVAG